MADREQSDTSKRASDQRLREGMIGSRHHSDGDPDNLAEKAETKPGGTVGRDLPDQSKERNTEIAVEAGRDDRRRREHK